MKLRGSVFFDVRLYVAALRFAITTSAVISSPGLSGSWLSRLLSAVNRSPVDSRELRDLFDPL